MLMLSLAFYCLILVLGIGGAVHLQSRADREREKALKGGTREKLNSFSSKRAG